MNKLEHYAEMTGLVFSMMGAAFSIALIFSLLVAIPLAIVFGGWKLLTYILTI